jgi:hypothetical protein
MDCTCTTPATERVEIEADNNQADKVLSTFFEVKKTVCMFRQQSGRYCIQNTFIRKSSMEDGS